MIELDKYATIREIKQQETARWVVLTDLLEDELGILGGIVRYVAETRTKAGDKALALERGGIETLISRGGFEPLHIGEVFAD